MTGKIKPVVQSEKNRVRYCQCGRYCKKAANRLGIFASDPTLWSKTNHVRELLSYFEIKTGGREITFTHWNDLPDCALLATKWHIEKKLFFLALGSVCTATG